MILTVTLNPAFDKIYWVKDLKLEGETILSRAYRSYSSAGGKGINVSIYLGRLGVDNIAMGFIAGHTGRAIKRSVREEGVTTNFNWIDGETRTNVAILRKKHKDRPIEVNEQGPPVPEKVLRQFWTQYEMMLKRASYAVISGSLPPNVPDDIYARMVKKAKGAGVKTIVNTGGPQLDEVVKEGPLILKPDIRESKTILGEPLTDQASVLRMGRKILQNDTDYVLVSYGVTGDILIGPERAWRLQVDKDDLEIKNEVGGGDALIGGIVYKLADGEEMLEAVKYGMASAVASVQNYEKLCRDMSLVHAERENISVTELKEEGIGSES